MMTFFEGVGGVTGRRKGLGGEIRSVLDIVNLISMGQMEAIGYMILNCRGQIWAGDLGVNHI